MTSLIFIAEDVKQLCVSSCHFDKLSASLSALVAKLK